MIWHSAVRPELFAGPASALARGFKYGCAKNKAMQ
jgi:hypothetical protein